MIPLKVALLTSFNLIFLLSAISHERASAAGPASQFAKVAISSVPGASGPTSAFSTTIEPLHLRVGSAGLEASLRTDLPPAAAGIRGLTGTLFVAANSVGVTQSTATVDFEYNFPLSQHAQLIFLRFDTGAGQGNEVSFQLEREGLPVIGSTGEPLALHQGNLAPGLYRLSIMASASADAEIARRFTSTQANFALLFLSVPEPGTAALAGTLLVSFCLRPRRVWRL